MIVKVVSSVNQSHLLTNCSNVGSFSIFVEAHQTLKTSHVMSAPDYLLSTKEELLENPKSQNAIEVHRTTLCKIEEFFCEEYLILTFNSPTLPEKSKATYLTSTAHFYIPNPLRRFE